MAGSQINLNIASHLHEFARQHPHRMAVIVPERRSRSGRACYSHLTFRQLDEDSDRIAAGLMMSGIHRGARAAVMVRPGLDFFSLTFALFKANVVPILIDPGMGIRSLGRCLNEAEPEIFVGIPPAIWARRLLGWGQRTVTRVIKVSPGRSKGGLTRLDDIRALGRDAIGRGEVEFPVLYNSLPGETAAILFTSGSTGTPKGAVYTHEIFQAQVAVFREIYSIESGEIDLCTFPLFALFAPALGMTSVVPEMDPTRPARVDPARIFEAIEDFGPTNMFGSPALLRKVGPAGVAAGVTFPTLKRVASAGAPASPRVLETFAKLLHPPTEIFTPYGATEGLPVASIGSREILEETRFATDRGAGVCVGRPVPGITLKIIRITDDPIPYWSEDLILTDGAIGEIVVSGSQVTRTYYGRPEADRVSKIADPARATIYHRMGDVGYRDQIGRIWFCGRKSHRVVLKDKTLYTLSCEGVFNAHPDVARTALVGVTRRGEKIPVLCVEPLRELTPSRQDSLRRDLLDRGNQFEHTRSIKTLMFHPSFPVDIRHNSKIFREKLAKWAARKLP